MLTRCKQVLHSSKPVVVMTALVAVLGITGTAYSAKLITGLDVRDGSLTTADLSKKAQAALHGGKGDKGLKGDAGKVGTRGLRGAAGVQGAVGGFGQTGAQGPTGLKGATGDTGAASTVAGPQGQTGAASTVVGPQGPIGPGGTTEGASCTVPGPKTGTIHWTLVGGATWSLACINVA